MVGSISAYSLTSTIESNNVLNKGLLEITGYAVPSVIMANNKVEARERAEKSAALFGLSFLVPLVFIKGLNKGFSKLYKISDSLKGPETRLIEISKKYLVKDAKYMEEGIKELADNLDREGTKGTKPAFDKVLEKFPDKEKLRQALIKAQDKVLLGDYLLTGGSIGAIYWLSNENTKKKTGRDGFSAEFEMADKDYTNQKSQEYIKNKRKNILIANGILVGGSLGVSQSLKKAMSSNSENKIVQFAKKHAHHFDYKKGVYMSRASLALIMLMGDIPNTLLASRDKDEFKNNAIRNALLFSVFFGGDLVLNNVAAQLLDKYKGTKLVNKENLPKDASWFKKITCPLNSLDDLKNKNWDAKVLKKTKNYGTAMFWGNFAIITATLGFALPSVLNKMLRQQVKQDLNNNPKPVEQNKVK